jgi:hypothetical protein
MRVDDHKVLGKSVCGFPPLELLPCIEAMRCNKGRACTSTKSPYKELQINSVFPSISQRTYLQSFPSNTQTRCDGAITLPAMRAQNYTST